VLNEAACQALSITSNSTSYVGLFPNPTKRSLNILTEEQIKKVSLFNIVGKKIRTYNNSKINVSYLKPGVYILEIIFENDSKVIKKIIREN
jgi:hypothetical protein